MELECLGRDYGRGHIGSEGIREGHLPVRYRPGCTPPLRGASGPVRAFSFRRPSPFGEFSVRMGVLECKSR